MYSNGLTEPADIREVGYIKGLEKFSMDTKEEIFEFVILLFSFVFNSTLNYYLSNESQEHAKHVLEKKLKYLQNGIIKKEYRGDNI